MGVHSSDNFLTVENSLGYWKLSKNEVKLNHMENKSWGKYFLLMPNIFKMVLNHSRA